MSILPKAKSKPRVAASKPAIWPAARLRCTSVFPYGENLGAGRIHFARACKITGSPRDGTSRGVCGITFEKFQDIKEGDIVEAYLMEQIEV